MLSKKIDIFELVKNLMMTSFYQFFVFKRFYEIKTFTIFKNSNGLDGCGSIIIRF